MKSDKAESPPPPPGIYLGFEGHMKWKTFLESLSAYCIFLDPPHISSAPVLAINSDCSPIIRTVLHMAWTLHTFFKITIHRYLKVIKFFRIISRSPVSQYIHQMAAIYLPHVYCMLPLCHRYFPYRLLCVRPDVKYLLIICSERPWGEQDLTTAMFLSSALLKR